MALRLNTSTLTADQQPALLPAKGLKREKDILPFLPFGRSTLWKWAGDGRFPAPVRIGSITCWKCEEVWAWLEQHGCSRPLAIAA